MCAPGGARVSAKGKPDSPNTTVRPRRGSGVGLLLVRTLVELHGGRAEASSAGRGRGSEFVVRLPVADWDSM